MHEGQKLSQKSIQMTGKQIRQSSFRGEGISSLKQYKLELMEKPFIYKIDFFISLAKEFANFSL